MTNAHAKLGPQSRRTLGTPWDGQVSSMRELIAAQVHETVREEDTLGDIHARFAARFKCPACGLTAVCPHRDRTADLRLILGGTGQEEITQ